MMIPLVALRHRRPREKRLSVPPGDNWRFMRDESGTDEGVWCDVPFWCL